MNNIFQCDICGEQAETLCTNCKKYFCEPCFKFVHEKKKNVGHKKEVIDPFVPIETKCPIHPDVPINLFCVTEKELLCSICQMLNPHKDHKIVLLDDEESLKKENLTVDSIEKGFSKDVSKIDGLKEEIEKEITKINTTYDNINNEIVKFFQEKLKKLKEEENELKENLDNKVTQIKEKLENFLSECNKILKINGKISNGLEKLKKDNENNTRRLLSYLSAINKNQKEINTLLNQPMSNLKIDFEKEKCNIKYEEYNFNNKSTLSGLTNILNENDASLIISWLPKKPKIFKLLFDTTKDGDYSSTFHQKCDGKCPTLVIIKSSNGYIFGSYDTSPWNSNSQNINAPNSFIFSLNQKQKYYASSENNSIIYGGSRDNQQNSYMFKIGCCDVSIMHNCTSNNQNRTNCDKFSVPSKNILNGGNQYFTVSNLEVYEINY